MVLQTTLLPSLSGGKALLYVIYGTAELLRIISGPAVVVNCAIWKPRNVHMLVFARDDRTIPIRGEAQRNT
ncbi:hypothetical protein MKW98_016098 [Papaver atlanticum]|uniref:Uncharacterized protein n=1 Tax=Papaver atlanticum TaxID=357466 RepID=A0AAD4T3F6_9MAGN|nr:hypothetical protein MKW98_016098 [Papaver atlanticum]